MNLGDSFIVHSSGKFWKPVIQSGYQSHDASADHYVVEVSHYEVSRVEQNLDRGLRQKEAAHPAGDEHRNKAQRKQRS